MHKKALPTVVAAAALAVLTAAPAFAADTAAQVTVKIELGHTETVKESAGVSFRCPVNQVLTGRAHSGDENGNTTYYCSSISINDQPVTVGISSWSPPQKESTSRFAAPIGEVLTGRRHQGDENGPTEYRHAPLTWQGRPVQLISRTWSGWMKENRHSFTTGATQVLTGRQHTGDENGDTRYLYATVTIEN
ncbi:hypothetical protein GCM10017600_46170 [Streptosporangium carneum]|uniref:Uncharacterized protein n=1 Tax=Streptosporangium carneum TaxID=47481 RepID=A0A9W6I4E5_9ACTN|nr:hypothetical protein GCM10017600_46170 [Streptosporangium carneum]